MATATRMRHLSPAARGWMPARAAAAVLLVLVQAGGLLLAGGGPGASAQPLPSPSRGMVIPNAPGDLLLGVRCTSADNCWAVGENGADHAQALHWNGRRWATVATPNPGNYFDVLDDVACTSAANCWAVGSAAYTSFKAPNMALHWNGLTWSLVSTPSPETGQGFNELHSVTCVSASDCWGVGDTSLGGEILHWNGGTWSLAPQPPGELEGVRCTSSANCWAVGTERSLNMALHWNGHRWSAVPTPGSGVLSSVRCTSAAYCLAVGASGQGGYLNEAARWNGSAWSLVSTPKPHGTIHDRRGLAGLACTSPSNCWAVGPPLEGFETSLVNQALHWNGRGWSYVSVPSPGTGEQPVLSAVSCTSSANCWAVGSDGSGNQVLHWNGNKWSVA